MWYKADFHIHSCLSPCASLEMSPQKIAKKANREDIHILALTDHNSAENCPAFYEACARYSIYPLFGLEVTTTEEVHVLCIFGKIPLAMDFSEKVNRLLPNIHFDPEKVGDRVIVNVDEEIIDSQEKYLVSSCNITLEDLYFLVMEYRGIFIPSHIDRPLFGLISQLGFIPDIPYTALEITNSQTKHRNHELPLITNSDAHYLKAIGKKYFRINIEKITFDNIKRAFKKNDIQIDL